MRVFAVTVVTVFLISVISCGTETGADLDAERLILLDTDRQFAAMSEKAGAAEAFRFYLSESALQLPSGGFPVEGRDEIYRRMIATAGSYTLHWTPRRAEIAASRDMGWTWGEYVYTFTDEDGRSSTSHGKYLNVWEKQSGGMWRVVVDMGNDSPTPAE